MSIVNGDEVRIAIRPDRTTERVRDAVGSLSARQMQALLVETFRRCGVPWRTIAVALRCTEAAARKASHVPTADLAGLIRPVR